MPPRFKSIGAWFFESFVASFGVVVSVSFVLVTLSSVLPQPQASLVKSWIFLPWFQLQIGAAAIVGYVRNTFRRRPESLWTWILPAAIFCWTAISRSEHASVLDDDWPAAGFRELMTPCGGPTCHDQFVIALPLYCAIGYCLGAAAERLDLFRFRRGEPEG